MRDESMSDSWQTLLQIFSDVAKLLAPLWQLLVAWLVLIVWIVWWLWGVNRTKTWAVLAQGAWVPVLLLLFIGALVWSQMSPSDCTCLGFVTIPNFWWQLGSVGLLAALTLFCGWLQGILNWAPAEINLEPPPPAAHGHGHHH
jgi:hypothetical protein